MFWKYKQEELFLLWVINVYNLLMTNLIQIFFNAVKISFRRYLHADSVQTERHVVECSCLYTSIVSLFRDIW